VNSSTAILALYYIFLARTSFRRSLLGSDTELVTVALLLANKYLHDVPPGLDGWSRLSGIPKKRLCVLERRLLKAIRYQTFLHVGKFNELAHRLVSYMSPHYED
jgi:hypothetical protein